MFAEARRQGRSLSWVIRRAWKAARGQDVSQLDLEPRRAVWREGTPAVGVTSDVFAPPVSDEAAYWIGLLMSDGCVHESGAIRVPLAGETPELLEKLQRFVGGGVIVRRGGVRPSWCYEVESVVLVRSLRRYGIVPRASRRVVASGGVENNRHFWRGMIDGDGWIGGMRGGKQRSLGLSSGSRELMEQFAAYVRSVYPDWHGGVVRMGSCWAVSLAGRSAVVLIRELYRNCTVASPRRMVLAREILLPIHRQSGRVTTTTPTTPIPTVGA